MPSRFSLPSTADGWPPFEARLERREARLRVGAEGARGLTRDREGWALLEYPNGDLLDLPRALYVAFHHLPPFDELPLGDPGAGGSAPTRLAH
jgi:hypothetical protein